MAYGESEITARLADYAVSTAAGDLPAHVRHEALRSFFNIVGCTIGGARHEIVDLADKTMAPFAGPQQATLFARGRKADVLHASLINAFASSIYSFDDTHAQAVVHPSGPVAAAVLALAEMRPVSGEDLLTAFALGVPAAYALNRWPVPGARVVEAALLSPFILPVLITGLGLLQFLAAIDLRDAPVKLFIGHILVTLPYLVRTVTASLKQVDRSLE